MQLHENRDVLFNCLWSLSSLLVILCGAWTHFPSLFLYLSLPASSPLSLLRWFLLYFKQAEDLRSLKRKEAIQSDCASTAIKAPKYRSSYGGSNQPAHSHVVT